MLSSFFNPASVAVVGAADDTAKLRGKLLKLLVDSGYPGPIYPVHPRAGRIQGRPAFAHLSEIPGGVELVLIATPGHSVPGLVSDAVNVGAKAAVILSSDVDRDALRLASGSGPFRFIGPNSEGFVAGTVAATFSAVVESALADRRRASRTSRKVSIVSQSGGLGFALYGRGLREHLDFHAVITTGNEGDLECLDFVEHLLDEGETGSILMFIEGFKTPSRFAAVAGRAADQGIPLIVMKVGRSEAGQRAVMSHTAHLAGTDAVYDAVFERYGAIRVFDAEEMLAAAAAFSRFSHRRIRAAGVVSTSGGAGVWAADQCSSRGIEVPLLSSNLQQDLQEYIPSFGSTANPVDMTAQAVEDGGLTLINVLKRLQRADEIDAVIVNMGLAKPGRIEAIGHRLSPLLETGRKPVLFHSHILPSDENLEALADLGGHGFQSFRGCAAALDALNAYAAFQERWSRRQLPTGARPARLPSAEPGVLSEAATRSLLEAYAIPLPPAVLVSTSAQATAAAATIGFPVALKIQSPDIAHKTEVGGVALDVGAGQVEAAFQRVLANAGRHAPQASIEGVVVQKMMPKGHEFVVGMTRDAEFGPMVMLGSGGIHLEVIKDVLFAPPPISRNEALRLIDRLKTAPILKGARGQMPGDIDALADLISQVGELARQEAGIDQLDLNPVLVFQRGAGVVAVDALVVAGRRVDQVRS
ncbi:MAG: hypothetical protein JWO52_7495 [Gammaproteobacteria bacterium]|nr:hypothetical protein [Gammaproteobacteria bacterium]